MNVIELNRALRQLRLGASRLCWKPAYNKLKRRP